MVGYIEGVTRFELTHLPLLLSSPARTYHQWNQRPKLHSTVEAWMLENVGYGDYWTYNPVAHGMKWSLEHSADVNWSMGRKYYEIYSSILSFAEADRAMLFKLTWL